MLRLAGLHNLQERRGSRRHRRTGVDVVGTVVGLGSGRAGWGHCSHSPDFAGDRIDPVGGTSIGLGRAADKNPVGLDCNRLGPRSSAVGIPDVGLDCSHTAVVVPGPGCRTVDHIEARRIGSLGGRHLLRSLAGLEGMDCCCSNLDLTS